MEVVFVGFLGLSLGSFVNALVWRIHEQSKLGAKKSKRARDLSVMKGRSMCPHCHHVLAPLDLVPLFSWLGLGGKCRYCHKPIGWQYPVVELSLAVLFIVSYVFWPSAPLEGAHELIRFGAWLVILTGFMALVVYDIKWMLLPNRIVYPLIVLAALLAAYNLLTATYSWSGLGLSVAIAGGIFYLLFTVSDGRWIGGGDVKLGALIGLALGDPYLAFFTLFLASMLGTLVVVPGLALKKVSARSRIPFGPFLIVAAIAVKLFGAAVITWYEHYMLAAV